MRQGVYFSSKPLAHSRTTTRISFPSFSSARSIRASTASLCSAKFPSRTTSTRRSIRVRCCSSFLKSGARRPQFSLCFFKRPLALFRLPIIFGFVNAPSIYNSLARSKLASNRLISCSAILKPCASTLWAICSTRPSVTTALSSFVTPPVCSAGETIP